MNVLKPSHALYWLHFLLISILLKADNHTHTRRAYLQFYLRTAATAACSVWTNLFLHSLLYCIIIYFFLFCCACECMCVYMLCTLAVCMQQWCKIKIVCFLGKSLQSGRTQYFVNNCCCFHFIIIFVVHASHVKSWTIKKYKEKKSTTHRCLIIAENRLKELYKNKKSFFGCCT